ncbi:hypothetical protein BDR03DRAFT_138414 [Suillus americanus]|nr:hypothetical protein BDR03DRAFT_138414 [Suillus americanus]
MSFIRLAHMGELQLIGKHQTMRTPVVDLLLVDVPNFPLPLTWTSDTLHISLLPFSFYHSFYPIYQPSRWVTLHYLHIHSLTRPHLRALSTVNGHQHKKSSSLFRAHTRMHLHDHQCRLDETFRMASFG